VSPRPERGGLPSSSLPWLVPPRWFCVAQAENLPARPACDARYAAVAWLPDHSSCTCDCTRSDVRYPARLAGPDGVPGLPPRTSISRGLGAVPPRSTRCRGFVAISKVGSVAPLLVSHPCVPPWSLRELDPRPLACHASALPAELRPLDGGWGRALVEVPLLPFAPWLRPRPGRWTPEWSVTPRSGRCHSWLPTMPSSWRWRGSNPLRQRLQGAAGTLPVTPMIPCRRPGLYQQPDGRGYLPGARQRLAVHGVHCGVLKGPEATSPPVEGPSTGGRIRTPGTRFWRPLL
jgi:hypothetical protein